MDLIIGDPTWRIHPVRLMGAAAGAAERVCRALPIARRLAGALAVLLVVGGAATLAALAIRLAAEASPFLAALAAGLGVWSSVGLRDLLSESRNVQAALSAGDLPAARQRVGRLVGRDTAQLDEAGITRAAVESVAESGCDGVIAPLFYAALGGPVAAVAYRAINTLDSMWGHRDERYRDFGWAAARLDDAANWLPARLTALFFALSAALLPAACLRNPLAVLMLARRNAPKHASVNAGWPEAAAAAALGVQLGGVNYYDGVAHEGALLGEARLALAPAHIGVVNRLVVLATLFWVVLVLLLS